MTSRHVKRQRTERLRIFEHNREALQRQLAGVPCLDNMVALVADATDTRGEILARVMDPDGIASRIAGNNQIPTITAVMPWESAHGLMSIEHPAITAALEKAVAPGMIQVLIVAAEGVTLVSMGIETPVKAVEA